MENYEKILNSLSKSKFRSHFKLSKKDKQYVLEKGYNTILGHATDFVKKRLAPAVIQNDGKQTPMHGHPVFVAQHATATCCRGCLCKWHKIEQNKQLSESEQQFVVGLIIEWIKNQMEN